MSPIEEFRKLVDAWCAATGENYGGLSARIFNRDGSRLARVMAGADLTTTWHWKALRWLDQNWPKDAAWPEGVRRPVTAERFDADAPSAAGAAA